MGQGINLRHSQDTCDKLKNISIYRKELGQDKLISFPCIELALLYGSTVLNIELRVPNYWTLPPCIDTPTVLRVSMQGPTFVGQTWSLLGLRPDEGQGDSDLVDLPIDHDLAVSVVPD